MLYCVAYKQPPLWYLFIRRSDAFAYDFAYCPPCQLQETKRERERRRREMNVTPAIEELSVSACATHNLVDFHRNSSGGKGTLPTVEGERPTGNLPLLKTIFCPHAMGEFCRKYRERA